MLSYSAIPNLRAATHSLLGQPIHREVGARKHNELRAPVGQNRPDGTPLHAATDTRRTRKAIKRSPPLLDGRRGTPAPPRQPQPQPRCMEMRTLGHLLFILPTYSAWRILLATIARCLIALQTRDRRLQRLTRDSSYGLLQPAAAARAAGLQAGNRHRMHPSGTNHQL